MAARWVQAGIFADYSQWEAFRSEPAAEKTAVKESRPATLPDEPKRKLSYLQQREWDGMESKILEAEQELARFQQELATFASDAERVGRGLRKNASRARPRRRALCALGGTGSLSREVNRGAAERIDQRMRIRWRRSGLRNE